MVSGLMCVASFGSAYGSSNRHHCRRCSLLFSSRLYRRCNRVLVRFFEEVRLASLTDNFDLLILVPTLVRSFAATTTHHVELFGAEIFSKAARAGSFPRTDAAEDMNPGAGVAQSEHILGRKPEQRCVQIFDVRHWNSRY